MDPVRFDRLAKSLSTPSTRRDALAALLAGSLGLLVLPRPAQGRKRRGGGGVTIEGPCGDGSGADNRCKHPEDCCTGICERTRPGKSKRCRCRREGQSCTETINCCQGAGQNLVCDEGTCQPGPCTSGSCPSGQDCLSNGTCAIRCNGVGDCDPYGGDCFGFFGGATYCVCGREGTCGCGENPNTCPQGSLCAPDNVDCNSSSPATGCFELCAAP